jgi:hypothetical protein
MSSYAPWKALERRHAKRLGGERLWRPDYGDSAPDGQTETDIWDCKAYESFRVHTIFQECFKKYADFAAGRRFHLCLFSRRNRGVGDLVVLRAEDFAELVAAADVGRGLVDTFTRVTSE